GEHDIEVQRVVNDRALLLLQI
ncbi:hypothetical protein VCHENC02_2213B, partial [Vibrio harveyi]